MILNDSLNDEKFRVTDEGLVTAKNDIGTNLDLYTKASFIQDGSIIAYPQ